MSRRRFAALVVLAQSLDIATTLAGLDMGAREVGVAASMGQDMAGSLGLCLLPLAAIPIQLSIVAVLPSAFRRAGLGLIVALPTLAGLSNLTLLVRAA